MITSYFFIHKLASMCLIFTLRTLEIVLMLYFHASYMEFWKVNHMHELTEGLSLISFVCKRFLKWIWFIIGYIHTYTNINIFILLISNFIILHLPCWQFDARIVSVLSLIKSSLQITHAINVENCKTFNCIRMKYII